MAESTPSPTFLARHEFLIRRLHSLSGLIPVGAYMVVHLLTNASVLNGSPTFQKAVYQIHSLGALLPVVEWTFIFIPILFHGIVGLVIIRGGLPNSGTYAYASNIRYTLQRATGLIAFAFIAWHVFHMHGWIHAEWWTEQIVGFGALFRPYNAASSAGAAMQQSGIVIPLLYFAGVAASVFHLANGIWTMGITWGAWTTPAAQARANWIALAVGILLMAVGMGAIFGFATIDVEEAATIENEMYEAAVEAHRIDANEHKRSHAEDSPPAENQLSQAPGWNE